MKFKTGIKVLLSMFSVGGMLTLASCGDTSKEEKNPSSEFVSVNSTSNTSTSSKTNTIIASSTSKNDGNSSTSTTTSIPAGEVIDDTLEKIGFETKIEKSYKDKINERLEENIVSDVDAKYFTIKNDANHGKTLETACYVTLTENNEVKPATLAMPLTDTQYEALFVLNDVNYIETNDLQQNYSKEQLDSVHNVVSAEDVTYSYAILDGHVWDLDQLTAVKIENMLETKYKQQIYDYFVENYNNDSLAGIDLKYVKLENTSSYGNVLRFYGKTIAKEGVELPLCITVGINENNYENLKNDIQDSYSETADLSQNYSKEQLYEIYCVDCEDSTETKEYKLNKTGYVVKHEDAIQ